jgi:hypothetical protein
MSQLHLVGEEQEPIAWIPAFDEFWDLWPRERRICKKLAVDQWKTKTPTERAAAVTALINWREVWLRRGEMDYVPHPHRWIRDERWTDELPSGYQHQSHVPAKLPEVGERTEMPQKVRDALAKLRSR